MQIGSFPIPNALDAETYAIRMARALRGFRTRQEAVLRLEVAGYSPCEIMAHSGRAIHREVNRQQAYGERPRIVTEINRVPGFGPWLCRAVDHKPGDPVGEGPGEFAAIEDYWLKWEARHA